MKHITVGIKRLSENAVIPTYAKNGDAGRDLVATSINETEQYIEYGTGIALSIPNGFVGLIYPRSSLSNYDLILANHVGVIDSGYRGEVKFRFKKTKDQANSKYYQVGDKIGQLIVMEYPLVVMEEFKELDSTQRGTGGYGSSGV